MFIAAVRLKPSRNPRQSAALNTNTYPFRSLGLFALKPAQFSCMARLSLWHRRGVP